MPQLRSAFMGEALGFAYANATRRISLEAHSYRLGLVVGVQPERAGALLDGSDGGTPQRFVWLPATDPNLTANPDPEPTPMRIDATHVARVRGEGDALDGHALFARRRSRRPSRCWTTGA